MHHVSPHRRTGRGFLLCFCFVWLLRPASSQPAKEESLSLFNPGTESVVRYSAYGKFENAGTPSYQYKITNRVGLANAVGLGLYPNTTSLERDPAFRKLLRAKKLDGPLENFRADVNPELAYYKWASQKGIPYQGLRMYNIGQSLEEAGYLQQALKAYYAVIVHFPKEVAWIDGRPWYVGVSALDEIDRVVEEHPELDLSLQGAFIHIQNGFDGKVTNDIVSVNPGEWIAKSAPKIKPGPLTGERANRWGGSVRLVQRDNGQWQLFVENKPYLVRGIAYSPTQIGRSPDVDDYKPHEDWMMLDTDKNGRIDSPHDAWVDANKNGLQDSNEPSVGDFELMKKMGVNTIRLYHHSENKALLKELSARYGIRVLMGDLLGAYTVGSGAEWEEGTDYTNPDQLEKMRASVRDMVLLHKDEDYVLMWVLGNENNYGYGNNANKNPDAFYRFVNSLAQQIHAIDPSHPVALSNGDLENLELIADSCPAVDVLAINAYHGPHGLGESFWKNLNEIWKKPVLVSEFGCPAYNAHKSLAAAETDQANYLLASWNDIERHGAGAKIGNSIGGVIFEWLDEWWKSGPEYDIREHDTVAQAKGAFPGGYMYEEWLGVVSQGKGQQSPFLRELRPAYFAFQKGPWKRSMNFPTGSSSLIGERIKESNEN